MKPPLGKGLEMSESLSEVRFIPDIFPAYQKGPVEDLISYQNLGKPHKIYIRPKILIGTCMDHRIDLCLPRKFACILRVAGGDLRRVEFDVSYAVSMRGISAIALVGHENCGMENLLSQRDQFVDGLVSNGGWERPEAEEHFDQSVAGVGIRNSIAFVRYLARRLRDRYPSVLVAPLFYSVEKNVLYQIREKQGTP